MWPAHPPTVLSGRYIWRTKRYGIHEKTFNTYTQNNNNIYYIFNLHFSLLSLKFIKFAERVWKFAAAREALEKAGWKELDGCLVLPGITPWSVAGTSGAHLKKIVIYHYLSVVATLMLLSTRQESRFSLIRNSVLRRELVGT